MTSRDDRIEALCGQGFAHDWESDCLVSPDGKEIVRASDGSKPSIFDNGSGYLAFTANGRMHYVHIAVHRAFLGFIWPHNEVHHKDFNRLNNWYTNLVSVSPELHKRLHSL